jgi:ribonuclease III
MSKIEDKKLQEIQQIIGYHFKNQNLLIQALTTPGFAHEKGLPDYEILETLGDAVLKLIFILKKYKEGVRDPGELTKVKISLESDKTLKKIAQEYFLLHNFIYTSKNQKVKGTKILADVFEAICGAIYLDSKNSLEMVERKIVDKFYPKWITLFEETTAFNKNKLLEFLQEQLKCTPQIELQYKKSGPDDNPMWKAKDPKILDKNNSELKSYSRILKGLESHTHKTKKEAEKDLYLQIYNYLKRMG